MLGKQRKMLATIFSTTVLVLCGILTPLQFLGPSTVKAEGDATTVYYGFESVSSFTTGNTYMFLPNTAGVTVDQNSCLLGLPDGTATLLATDEENYAQYEINSFNESRASMTPEQIEEERQHVQEQIDQWNAGKAETIANNTASYQSYFDRYPEDAAWYEQYYGTSDPAALAEMDFNNMLSYYQQMKDSLQDMDPVTIDTYVSVVASGAGFDSCSLGALGNGGTTYFCDGGGVQNLKGMTATYKTAEISSSSLSAVLTQEATSKIGSDPVTIDPSDVVVTASIEGQSYNITTFTITDNSLDPANGDNEISIQFGNTTATITVQAASAPEEVPAEPTVVTGRGGSVTAAQLAADNQAKVIQDGSAAAQAGITSVDALANGLSDGTTKAALIEKAIETGNVDLAVTGTSAVGGALSISKSAAMLAILSPQEMFDAISGNDNILLNLQITEVDAATIDNTVVDAINSNKNAGESIYYFNADLFLTTGYNTATASTQQITEFASDIGVTVNVPANLRAANRVFRVIWTHTDVATGQLQSGAFADQDSDANTVTFATNRLCTMAFAYSDAQTTVVSAAATPAATTTNEAPKTRDYGGLFTMMALFMIYLASAGLGVISRKED